MMASLEKKPANGGMPVSASVPTQAVMNVNGMDFLRPPILRRACPWCMARITDRAVSDNSNSGDMRATMKMPAVTMVAAWISAEIGVGPSIESGSQTCNGNCADLPIAPVNRREQLGVTKPHDHT